MAGDTLRVAVEGGVARLTFTRADKHNAFDDALIAGLTAALERVAVDTAVRVVVLAGEGKSFSAGADLDWMRRMADYGPAENLADARELARMMQVLADLPKPTLARVHGAAYGGGVGLVAACDIAIATPQARFVLSEAKLGLIPAVISPYVVEAIGARAARRYFQTAEMIDAETALRLGLVHEVVTECELDVAIDGLIENLLANGPQAMAASKDLIRRVAGPRDAAMIEDTAQRIADIRATAEGKEGVRAFLEKRKPSWQSR